MFLNVDRIAALWAAVALAAPIASAPADAANAARIVVLGDSLAAGRGVQRDQAFPAALQQKIKERGWPFQVISAGVSGDTTADGERRLDWTLRTAPRMLIIELGGNDGLRGLDPALIKQNLKAIVKRARQRCPGLVLVIAGMQMPLNLGADYARRYGEVFPQVAREEKALLVPHFLEEVGGRADLMQADGIHPTAAGQAALAEKIWEVIEPVLARWAPAPAKP